MLPFVSWSMCTMFYSLYGDHTAARLAAAEAALQRATELRPVLPKRTWCADRIC